MQIFGHIWLGGQNTFAYLSRVMTKENLYLQIMIIRQQSTQPLQYSHVWEQVAERERESFPL